MAEEQRLRVELSGGGPWGFRLQGGINGEPVSVSKIRRRSKADVGELREGDIFVAANGTSINGRTHAQTMDLVDESGPNLSIDILRPGSGQISTSSSVNGQQHHTVSQQTLTSNDGDTTTQVRTDTTTENRPDGSSRRTTTTVTKQEQSTGYTMPFSQVQNTTARPFSPTDSESVTLTIDTAKENVPPMFNVKPAYRPDGPVAWSPDGPDDFDGQDPFLDEAYAQNAATMYMDSPSVSYEEQEMGYGVAPMSKVMPATPGLSSVDIQKLLEPADDPSDTPTKPNMRIYLDASNVEAVAPRKMYADSAFFDDPEAKYPTIQEQVKMAHQVAKLLMSEAAIKKSRGSQMFTKRRERAEKWVHEASDEEDQQKPGKLASAHVTKKAPPEAFYQSLRPESQIGVWNPILAGPPPAAPPPPPIHAPANPLNFQDLRDQKNTHTQVTPEKCFNLAAALHASKGRGGQIFAKRRAKSESWIVDESNVKSAPPPITPHAVLRPKAAKNQRFERSPWESANDPDGIKRHTVGPDTFAKMPDMSNLPKFSPADIKSKYNFRAEQREKKNFKDFNVRAKGWGEPGGEEPRSSANTSRTSSIDRQSSVPSSEDSMYSRGRAPPKMQAGNRFSMGYDPRQPAVNRGDLASALGSRGFVPVGGSGASDL